jgi:hypothetical protein
MQASNNEKRLLTLRRCNRPSERARSTDVSLVAFNAAPWSARQRRSHRHRIVHHIASGERKQEMLVALAHFGDQVHVLLKMCDWPVPPCTCKEWARSVQPCKRSKIDVHTNFEMQF